MARSKSAKMIGELVVSAGLLKSSSLGRIGKVSVKGMSGPLQPAPQTKWCRERPRVPWPRESWVWTWDMNRYGFRVGQSSTFHGLNMPNVSQLHGQMDAVIKLQPWQWAACFKETGLPLPRSIGWRITVTFWATAIPSRCAREKSSGAGHLVYLVYQRADSTP